MTKLIQEKCTSLSIKTQKTKSIKDKIQVKTQIPATETPSEFIEEILNSPELLRLRNH